VAVTGPGGQVTRTYYDALGRAISMVSNLTGWEVFNPAPPERGEEFNFRSDTMYDALGRVTSTFDPLGQETAYRYDSLGRQTMVIAPGDILTQFMYNAAGQLMNKTDAENVVTHFEYDDLGRLTAVVENYRPAYLPDEKTNVRTEYSYDASGNRLTIRDGNGHVTSFTYDSLNRLRSETDAVGNTWQYEYDARGSRTRLLDANQQETRYSYNALGQVTKIDYPGEDIDVAFDYDPLGRREQMSDSLGTTTWDYDALGRPRSITDPFDQTVYYGYNETGNRASLTYPDDKTVTYNYNEANRLSDVTDWNDQVTQYRYDPLGRLTEILRPNGVDTTYSFDETGNLAQLQHSRQDAVLSSFKYQYDAVGNRTQAVEYVSSRAGLSITVTMVESGGALLANVPVTAYNGTVPVGETQLTDANGQAEFILPKGVYRFKAEIDGLERWSAAENHCAIEMCDSVVISVPQAVLVDVKNGNQEPLEGLTVSAFDGATETGVSGVTDENGQVSLRLPEGNYRFRVDFDDIQYWSGPENHCTVVSTGSTQGPGCVIANILVAEPLFVSVYDSVWNSVPNQVIYAYQNGEYSGYSATTDQYGDAVFFLPAGSYRFKIEFNGVAFWSDVSDSCVVPDCRWLEMQVALPLTIAVVMPDGQPVPGLEVRAFDGATDSGFAATTNANGEASLSLPAGEYRFRAVYEGQEFWSGAENHCEIFLTLPEFVVNG
jgi:YD repeat-containing protein